MLDKHLYLCCIFSVCTGAFYLSQLKKQTQSVQYILLGEDLVIYLTCKVEVAGSITYKRAWNGSGIPLHGFLAQSQCAIYIAQLAA